METLHIVVVPLVIACALSGSCGTNNNATSNDGSRPRPLVCPDDERVHMTPELTQAEVCARNGYTLIVRFSVQEPQTLETFLPLLESLGATLACEDPNALAGQSGRVCYIIRLPANMCCSEGMAYFAGLSSPRNSTDVPDPATPCDCQTYWTSF